MSKLRAHAHLLLQLLDAELGRALRGMVERLGRALGPFSAGVAAGDGEPDGYAGIGREAHYERLLTSEWLLADVAPDEFLRRAAEGEHAFLALARIQPRARGMCVVLLDTGPDTLGLPRIAMLALLLAFELRAQAAGAELWWSALGAPVSFNGISSPAALRAFLDARTATPAAVSDFTQGERTPSELWVVGPPQRAREARREAHTVALHEPWGTGNVEVTLQRRGAGQRALSLEMPAEPACVRLLRDPFSTEARARAVPGRPVQSGLQFSGRGHRVLSVDHRGVVCAQSVPSHPDAAPGRARTFVTPAGERLLACTYTDRLVVVTAAPDALHVYGVPPACASGQRAGNCVLTVPHADTSKLSTSDPLGACLVLTGNDHQLVAWVRLAQGGTLLLGRRAQPSAHIMHERLLAGVQASRAAQAVWLSHKGGSMELVAQTPGQADWRTLARLAAPPPDEVFFFCPRERATVFEGWVGLRRGDRVSIASIRPPGNEPRFVELVVPERTRCVGLTIGAGGQPAIIVLEQDRKTFACISRGAAQLVLRAEQPVEHVQLCPHTRTLAYATPAQWTLFDMARECVLWTLPRGDGP